MNASFDNFIGLFRNAASDEFCDGVIEYYNCCEALGSTQNRTDMDTLNEKELARDNDMFFLPDVNAPKEFSEGFAKIAWDCYKAYSKEYTILTSLVTHNLNMGIKIQKTLPTKGYHIWHCETDEKIHAPRLLLVLLYLNDLNDGGETEFLYQSRRIPPEKGMLMICPAAFTHTHRGNPPLSGVKYVMNSWIDFVEDD